MTVHKSSIRPQVPIVPLRDPRPKLDLLGAVRVYREDSGGRLILTAPLQIAVLAYLVLARPRGLHARDTLIAMFWPEADTDAGRHALRNVLTAIRRALGNDAVVTAGHTLVGIDTTRVVCDARLLEDDLAASRLTNAIARYEGELLQGFHVSRAPEFERWLDAERRRFLETVVQAAWSVAAAHRTAGDLEAAALAAKRAAGLVPDDERALRRLLVLLGDAGQRAAAIRAYEEFAVMLTREFGAEPSAETKRVIEAIRGPRSWPPEPGDVVTLAVLPFVPDPSLSDAAGICESLGAGVFASLARMPRFIVRTRGVASQHAHAAVKPIAAGRSLEVDAIVTARVLGGAQPDAVMVRLAVIRVSDEKVLHQETFTSHDVDLHALEGQMAAVVGEALDASTPERGTPTRVARPSVDGEAYILYVRGNYLFLRAVHGGHAEDLNRSRDFFEQAIERDPGFALAQAGLTNYFAAAAVRNVLRPFREHFGHAIDLSRHVITLDPTQAIPHVHFGVQALYLDCDWDAAGHEFATATQLDPTYAEGHRFYGIYLGCVGRTAEAMRALREAARLEPHIAIFHNSLADAHMAARAYDEAIAALRTALRVDPQYTAARNRLIRCYERLGRFEDAVAERGEAGPSGLAEEFAVALRAGGVDGYRTARERELRSVIADLESRITDGKPLDASDYFSPVQLRLALAHAELGEWDRAREWEAHACSRRPGVRLWFRANADLAPLYSE